MNEWSSGKGFAFGVNCLAGSNLAEVVLKTFLLVVIKSGQAMRTHSDIGLTTAGCKACSKHAANCATFFAVRI